MENKMADIAQLEEQIVSLSLLEAAALVKKLEERLGVSAAAAAPGGCRRRRSCGCSGG
jgi:ribosomal protein L7/L12